MDGVLYITEKYLKDNTSISSNVDTAMLRPSMITAQDIYIADFLGYDLNNDLLTKLNNGTLSNIEKSLVNLIRKAQAHFTCYLSMNDIIYRFANKAGNTPATEAGATIDKDGLVYISTVSKNNGEFYLEKVRDFIKNNKADFSLWKGFNCSDASAYIFQIEYDKYPNRYVCNCIGLCRCNKNYWF